MVISTSKTKILGFILIFLNAVLYSCNEEEQIETSFEGINGCLLSSTLVEQEYVLHFGNTTAPLNIILREEGFSYAYNDENQLTSISYQFDELSCSPNQEGGDEICFGVDGGEITKLTYDENQVIFSLEDMTIFVTFDGEQIEKIKYVQTQGDIEEVDEYRYFYLNDELSKIENWDNYSGDLSTELILYSYSIYTHDNGNIFSKSDFFLSDNTSVRVISKKKLYGISDLVQTDNSIEESTTTYLFDDKINPFKGSLISIFENNGNYFNKNNIIQISRQHLLSDDSTSTSSEDLINYEYNENGFPVVMNYDESDDIQVNIFTTSFQYDCN